MDRDRDVGTSDFMFGAGGLLLCAIIAIAFAIFA
jgi:hypothetical protein